MNIHEKILTRYTSFVTSGKKRGKKDKQGREIKEQKCKKKNKKRNNKKEEQSKKKGGGKKRRKKRKQGGSRTTSVT